MLQVSIARRYARALLEASGDAAASVGTELEAIASWIDGAPELGHLFNNPSVGRETRSGLIEQLIAAGGLSTVTGNFMRLANDRGRIPYLPQIARLYLAMIDEREGRLRGTVTSATPLSSEQAERLGTALGAATGKTVTLQRETDASLLGGAVARVGNLVFDGSLRAQLEGLRRELSS